MRVPQSFAAEADAMIFRWALSLRAATISPLRLLSTTRLGFCVGGFAITTQGLHGLQATVISHHCVRPIQVRVLIGSGRCRWCAPTDVGLSVLFADAHPGFLLKGLHSLTFWIARLTGLSEGFDSETPVKSTKNF